MVIWNHISADAYGTIKPRYEIVETLRLNDDSTFIWKLDGLQGDLRDGYQTFVRNYYGEGIYHRTGDSLVLNTNDAAMPVLKTKFLKRKKHNKMLKRIKFTDSEKYFYKISYVLYIDEQGDTILESSMIIPELGPLGAGNREVIELIQPKEVIDIFIEPLALRMDNLKAINEHDGDIEITVKYDNPLKNRVFLNEKWAMRGDSIFQLTGDGYPSIYPLVKDGDMYVSKRKYMGKKYIGEFDSIRSKRMPYYNYKYHIQPKANNFKRYGLIDEVKAYDKNGRLLAEGEYLSDTMNYFLKWERFIKVGRWKYYEPDGTIRYVDY